MEGCNGCHHHRHRPHHQRRHEIVIMKSLKSPAIGCIEILAGLARRARRARAVRITLGLAYWLGFNEPATAPLSYVPRRRGRGRKRPIRAGPLSTCTGYQSDQVVAGPGSMAQVPSIAPASTRPGRQLSRPIRSTEPVAFSRIFLISTPGRRLVPRGSSARVRAAYSSRKGIGNRSLALVCTNLLGGWRGGSWRGEMRLPRR